MKKSNILSAPARAAARLGFFERYLSLSVALCMVTGIVVGKLLPSFTASLRGLQFGKGSQINVVIAVLIWLMITPMMMKVDFTSLRNVGRRPAGLVVRLIASVAFFLYNLGFAGPIPQLASRNH